MPDTITAINSYAFSGCDNITSITLPFVGASRTAVGFQSHFGYIFEYSGGGSITTYSTSSASNYKVGDVFSTSGDGIKYVTSVNTSTNTVNYSSYYYYSVPSALKTVAITDASFISDAAFYNCEYITNIQLNDSVSSVGAYAFQNVPWYTNLKSEFNIVGDGVLIKYTGTKSGITFPETVKYIGGAVFKNNTKISEVTISDQITGIGALAFNGCTNLTSLTIPKTVTGIGHEAIPSTCTILVYRPSAGYNYRSTNRTVLNSSYTTGL